MDKKYLVFVSSTYEDLKEERSAVMQVLLENDAIPTGMELFPATHDDKWELIKEVIQQCDYYVLISAGKYGSIDKNGKSYTENEYDYAISIDKPIISFLYEKIDKLTGDKIESTDEGKKKLDEFRVKVSKDRVCRFWKNVDSLAREINSSFQALKKRKPAIGWVRSDQKNPETSELVLQLKTTNEELEKKIMDLSKSNELDLADGEDLHNIGFNLYESDPLGDTIRFVKTIIINASWNKLFKIMPNKIFFGEISINEYEKSLNSSLYSLCEQSENSESFDTIRIITDDLFTIVFQFTKLNYLKANQNQMALTEFGKKKFTDVHVIKKEKQ